MSRLLSLSKSEYVNSQIVISYKTNKVDLERMGNEMINRFSCHNFRNINADNLEFEKINILIGPNNSGKTNLLKQLHSFLKW